MSEAKEGEDFDNLAGMRLVRTWHLHPQDIATTSQDERGRVTIRVYRPVELANSGEFEQNGIDEQSS